MNLDDLLKEMKEKMQSRDLSDKYLEENGKMTRTEMGIGEYSYGITTIPCEWVYNFLSDYKKVLKENEELTISNKEIDKECSRLEKKEIELINENEHYKDLIYALKTYYDITEEDLEKCMKNDR